MKVKNLVLRLLSLLLTIALVSCKSDETPVIDNCENTSGLLQSAITPEGQNILIYNDGNAYLLENGTCSFILKYFESNFLDDNYIIDGASVSLKVENSSWPVVNDFTEDFENYASFIDLFPKVIADSNLFWNSFTLQSPATPTVDEYNELRNCILAENCDFIDHKIELTADPNDAGNLVLKFTSLAPTADMVTAKCSISTQRNFFRKGDDLWYAADYFIASGMPLTIADFENDYFEQGPGPRVFISNNALAVENKFGAKDIFRQATPVSVPKNKWFTIKVHFKLSDTGDGIIELWQDGEMLISTQGLNIPTSNSIQNSLEVGISATSEASTMFMDNIKISDKAF